MFPHIPLLLMLAFIAIPSFLLGPLLSLVVPMIVNAVVAWIMAALGRATSWQATISPVIGHCINVAVAFLVTVILVKSGVSVGAGTITCLNDPATTSALGCLQAGDFSAILTFIVSLVTGHVAGVALEQHADFKARVGRYSPEAVSARRRQA